MKCWVVLLLLLLPACATSPPMIFTVDGVEIETWEAVETTSMNTQIETAVAVGETWPQSPLRITIELLGGDVDTRILRIEEAKSRTEGADTTAVVVIRDGFLDDSVRGDWHRIVFSRESDRTWRVHSARRAFRCYRGHHLESYSRQWCP